MPVAPVAKHVPQVRSHHGDEVSDPFEWLRDKDDPEVVAHLQAENRYAEEVTAHLAPLREAIFEEIRSRVQETDLSVPVRYRGWWYYTRTREGQQYAVHGRVHAGGPDAPVSRPVLDGDGVPEGEVVLLDGNREAEGHEFFSLGGLEVSPDGSLVAYSVDVEGDERFTLRIKVVDTGELLDDVVTETGTGIVWSLDGRYVFYTRVDEQWRQHQVWRHEVGAAAQSDQLVFEESDERFFVGLGVSRDDRWVVISVASKITSEVLLLDAGVPLDRPRVVAPRRTGVEYDVEPAGDRLLVVHNAGDPDFEVAEAPLGSTGHEDWSPFLPAVAGERVVAVEAFEGFVVVSMRRDGLTGLRVIMRDASTGTGFGAARDLSFDEPIYSVSSGNTPDYTSPTLQLVFESMVTPSTVYDYDVGTQQLDLLKRQQVRGGYDLNQLVQRREWAVAQDGTRVPISLVHKVGVESDGTAPGLLYGYGAYEHSYDPYFSVARLSLLDRGFVYAIAHVRGGGEMGRRWYEAGKLARKTNTFTDFVSCAAHLVDSGWVHPDSLAAEGGSAGGLLIGAAVNLAPQRFAAIHAQVPFVDALTTMLDPTLPLTVTERDEWGDPLADPAAYAYLKSYSPYENIGRTRYPAILATTSLNDTRVSFTEPAKWVARLRETVVGETDERPVLLRTEMSAGHGGRSGRYDAWRDYAWELAFLIDQVTRERPALEDHTAEPSMRRPGGDDGPVPSPVEPDRADPRSPDMAAGPPVEPAGTRLHRGRPPGQGGAGV